MTQSPTIHFEHLSKRFGSVHAVNDLSFTVKPGTVTGLLGPNGSGKTTSLRALLGLVQPSSGSAKFGTHSYRELPHAARTVGTVLEANSFHPAHTARRHLKIQAAAVGIPGERIDEVLDQVGMSEAADRKIGGYSLGMRQRLGLAAALLGDPQVIIMDEPINGLDPQGISWMRQLLKFLAAEGRTVLISSHLLAEVEQTVEQLVIINQGNLVYEGDIHSLAKKRQILVDSDNRQALSQALTQAHLMHQLSEEGFMVDSEQTGVIGQLALDKQIVLTRLHHTASGLEQSFFELIGGQR